MKVNRILLGLLVCASMSACSSEDDIAGSGGSSPVFTGDEAYINVRLSDVGSLSRATTTEDGYEYGSDNEHAVSNAWFFFYDEDGMFVSKGSAWNGGNESSTDKNIEFKGNNVVVLKGLTGNKYPKYMVTVLNCPSAFEPAETLDDMLAKLSEENTVGIIQQIGNTDYFVMSTSSYYDSTRASGKYFVTEVQESNFSKEPVSDSNSGNYVTVYVERLAAKVTLKVSESLDNAVLKDGKTYYKIKATVAGNDNDADVENSTNTGNQMAAEDLYVELLGWKLNATAKKSNMFKNISEDWTDSELGFVWNKVSDFRSFWGKSYNYGEADGNYPTSTSGATACKYLDYTSLNSTGLVDLGKSAYCAENTNTSGIVTANYPSAVTSILLKARVCDANGQALDLVRHEGVLFTKASFPNYVLSALTAKDQWNVWVKTSVEGVSDDNTYELANSSNVEFENEGDGKVIVRLVKDKTFYFRTQNADKSYTFSEITESSSVSKQIVNGYLSTQSANTIGYTGGLMYYNIPIEHLNNTAVTGGTIPEAKYGIVRNHTYVVTVNELENIGKGIFDEDETIVPGKDDDDKETYYVGAKINILSWKIVSQSVDL